jgi:hypothetical protein
MDRKNGFLWFNDTETRGAPGLELIMPEGQAEIAYELVTNGIRNINDYFIENTHDPVRPDDIAERQEKQRQRASLCHALRKLHVIVFPNDIPPPIEVMASWTSDKFNEELEKDLKKL